MNRTIFRKYDIRGVFPTELDEDSIRGVGASLASLSGGSLAVGRDCRPSGAVLFDWLSRGAGGGCRVMDLGVQTTPMTYFAAYTLDPGATAMITGSHNPPEYNGFKIMKGRHTLAGEEIMALAGDRPPQAGEPSVERVDVLPDYLDRLMAEFSPERSLKIVVDGGNGTGGPPAVRILGDLGCRVVPLYCEMDGRFPNHHPDPTVESNLSDLKRTVVETGADLGIAFDGDADRLGVVDERGRTVFGDRLLIVLARDLLAASPGAVVISEVKASRVLFDEISKAGGRPVMSATGHSIIKNRMLEENALLAGEMSGHIFFRDRYYGFDDALYAALRLVEVLARSGGTMSELLSGVPEPSSTPEIREDCPDAAKFGVVDRVRDRMRDRGYPITDIDGARIDFPAGWGLLRASNTQPVIVMRFEAADPATLREYERIVREELAAAMEESDVQTGG
jgi:phosphomannomutase/phosphoglucomutase